MGKPPPREAKNALPNRLSGLLFLSKPHHPKTPGLVSVNAHKQIFHINSSGIETLGQEARSAAALPHEVTTSILSG